VLVNQPLEIHSCQLALDGLSNLSGLLLLSFYFRPSRTLKRGDLLAGCR
jgi:hypothetical protein